MAVNNVNIINGFAQHDTLCTHVVNMPETLCVNVDTMPDVQMDSITRIAMDTMFANIDSITSIITNISKEGAGYPSMISAVAIPLVISIIALACPLFLQTIHGLDDKYHSTNILRLFKSFWFFICYCIYLVLLTAFLLYWIFFRPERECLDVVLLTGVFILLFKTFCVLYISICYFDLTSLIRHIQIRERACIWLLNMTGSEYFRRLSGLFVICRGELLRYAIRNNSRESTKDLLSRFIDDFKSVRLNRKLKEPIEYTESQYQFVLELNEMLCQEDQSHVLVDSQNNHITPLALFFSCDEDFDYGVLSERTLSVIWECLLQYAVYKRFDLFKSYWRLACNYVDMVDVEAATPFIRFNEKVFALLMSESQYELIHELVYWKKEVKKSVDIFHVRYSHLVKHEDLLTFNKERILCRYLLLEDELTRNYEKTPLPNKSATSIMPNPIAEYAKKALALIFAISVKKNDLHIRLYPDFDEQDILKIDIQTIQRQINDFGSSLKDIIVDEQINKYFNIDKEAVEKIELSKFISDVEDLQSLACHLSSINEESKKIVDEGIKQSFRSVQKELTRCTSSQRFVKSRTRIIGVSSFIPKSYFTTETENLKKSKELKELSNRLYCSFVEEVTTMLLESCPEMKSVTGKDELLELLDKKIGILKSKKDYVIVGENAKCGYIFDGQSKYKGVDIISFPIKNEAGSECKVWFIRRETLPSYKIIDSQDEQWRGYRFTLIDQENKIRRLLLDIGLAPQEIQKSLQPYVQRMDLKIDTTVLLAVIFKLIGSTKKSRSGLCVNVTGLTPGCEDLYEQDMMDDWGDDDQYRIPEESVAEHNVLSEQEEYNKFIIRNMVQQIIDELAQTQFEQLSDYKSAVVRVELLMYFRKEFAKIQSKLISNSQDLELKAAFDAKHINQFISIFALDQAKFMFDDIKNNSRSSSINEDKISAFRIKLKYCCKPCNKQVKEWLARIDNYCQNFNA